MGVYKSQNKKTALMKSLRINLKEIQKKLINIIRSFENGFGNEEFNNRLQELTARKDEFIKALNDEIINNLFLNMMKLHLYFKDSCHFILKN